MEATRTQRAITDQRLSSPLRTCVREPHAVSRGAMQRAHGLHACARAWPAPRVGLVRERKRASARCAYGASPPQTQRPQRPRWRTHGLDWPATQRLMHCGGLCQTLNQAGPHSPEAKRESPWHGALAPSASPFACIPAHQPPFCLRHPDPNNQRVLNIKRCLPSTTSRLCHSRPRPKRSRHLSSSPWTPSSPDSYCFVNQPHIWR